MLANGTKRSTLTRWTQWTLAICVLFAGLGWTSTAAAEDLKIGYVDLHKALNNVPEGKAARAELKEDYKKKQQKLNNKQKEVKKLKEEIQNKGMALSKEARMKKQKKLRKKMMELQETYMGLQRDLSKKEAEKTKEIFDKMRDIVEEIADEKGYDLVLEKKKASVLYAKDGMDLTDELIERYKNKD